MRKILLLVLNMINCAVTFAQFDQGSSYYPTSANTGSNVKYSNTPVNLYSGIPNIEAPLCDLKTSKSSIPIALSYYAAGIKVQDVASSLGMGWSLSVNSFITRTVSGLPDESAQGYFGSSMGDKIYGPLTVQEMEGIGNNSADSEPDIFYFSINGQRGEICVQQK